MTEPALAQNVRGKGRHYQNPVSGDLVPSVTNVIGMLDKPALPRWAAKVVAEQAAAMKRSLANLEDAEIVDLLKGSPWRKSGRAANRGTDIHAYLEARLLGRQPDDLEGEARTYLKSADGVLEYLDRIGARLVESEVTVFGHGYAGTFDAHLEVPCETGYEHWLVDFKTGSSGPYDEVGLQLAALAHAHTKADGFPTRPFDRLVAIGINPKGWRAVQVVDPERCFAAFLSALTLWEWKNGDPVLTEDFDE